jgi:hypothetical protein
MSRQAMEMAISEVPGKNARVLQNTRAYLLEVADRLQDDILGILQASASYMSYMCLVVTPARIIGVGQEGSVEVWHYKDVTKVMIVGGKKKLLGGHDYSFFMINLPDGSSLTFQLFGDHEYTHRVGLRAEDAHRKAQIARLLSIRPAVRAG